MAEDIISVRRLLEYVGPREHVEKTLENSIKGTKMFGKQSITARTWEEFPNRVQGWNEGYAVAIRQVFAKLADASIHWLDSEETDELQADLAVRLGLDDATMTALGIDKKLVKTGQSA